jgi:hypothetical protein
LLHEEYLHIQNMEIMMFLEGMLWGAMYRASSDGSETFIEDYENLRDRSGTWARQLCSLHKFL